MNFSTLNTAAYPLCFLVAVRPGQFRDSLCSQLEHIKQDGWKFLVCHELFEALHFKQRERPLFVLAEFGGPQELNLQEWVEVLQLPLALLATGSEPSQETMHKWLQLSGVIGYCFPQPSVTTLYALIMQAYWSALAQAGLEVGSMLLAGAHEGI